MHEISVAGCILKLVEDAVSREDFHCVHHMRVEVGKLAGIEVSALRFALESMVRGTCLEETQIDFVEPLGHALCCDCKAKFSIGQRGDACPHCNSHALQIVGGNQMRVLEISGE